MSHGPGGDNPYTNGIAAFVAGLTYERIPADVIARIKLLILDSLGCALYGTELPWSRILMDTLGAIAIALLLKLGRDQILAQTLTTGLFFAFIIAVFKMYDLSLIHI